jgi:glutaredoxin
MTKSRIVYTISTCPACRALKEDWKRKGIDFEERQVDKSQVYMDEARRYGDMVPLIRYPNGRVRIGYKQMIG